MTSMPIVILPAIAQRIAELESDPRPIVVHELFAELNKLVADPDKLTDDERLGCQAEIVAWRFMPMRGKSRGPWDSYFGPFASGTTADGKEVHMPEAQDVHPEVIEHWRLRSEQTPHPVLRARYADLALEIGQIWNRNHLGGHQPSFTREISQRAIDAHLAAIAEGLEDSDHQAWTFLNRALDLALLIKDPQRVKQVKLAAFALCRKQRAAGKSGYWWNLDNMLWDRKDAAHSDAERDELIGWLQEALDFHADIGDPKQFDPHQAQDAANRLHRWSKKIHDPVRGIEALRKAGAAIEAMAAKSNALTAAAWLEDLSRGYWQAKLPDDAARVDATIKARSEEAKQSMKRHEVKLEISLDEMNKWLDGLLITSLEHSLCRISVHLMTSEEKLREHVINWAVNAPFQAHLEISLGEAYGFTRAKIGSLKDDMPGRIMNMAATLIGHHAPWLHIALERAKEQWKLDADSLFTWLIQSPLIPRSAHGLLRIGIEAWFAEDHLKAIHLLVPQVEAALREWLVLLGESPMQPDTDSGGFKAIGMGQVLHTDSFKSKVDSTLRLHLKALYTDPKGLNLRNRIAHGLASPELLNRGASNWVIHSLLAIRTYAHIRK